MNNKVFIVISLAPFIKTYFHKKYLIPNTNRKGILYKQDAFSISVDAYMGIITRHELMVSSLEA